jgi:glycogen debranching enzyme
MPMKSQSAVDAMSFERLKTTCDSIATDTVTNQSWIPGFGVCAGKMYYRDVWTRDAFFSCIGLLSIHKYNYVRQTLNTLKQYQRGDGLVPLRVGNKWYSARFLLGVDIPGREAVYECDKAGSEPTDSCPQLIVLTDILYHNTRNLNDVQSMLGSCEKAYSYMMKQAATTNDGLLHGRYFDTWHDTYAIHGPALFTNVFWVQSHMAMSRIRQAVGDSHGARQCMEMYKKTRAAVIRSYWNGTYLQIYPHIGNFEMAGNALAVLFGVVSRDKATTIFAYYDANVPRSSTSGSVTSTTVTIPRMPDKYVYWPMRWIGMAGYHNEHLWPWVHCLAMAATTQSNIQSTGVQQGYVRILQTTVRYGRCYERLDPDTMKPVRNVLQSSEIGFSESAGMMLFASHGGVIPVSSSGVL